MLFGMGWFSHCSCCTMTPPKKDATKSTVKVRFIIIVVTLHAKATTMKWRDVNCYDDLVCCREWHTQICALLGWTPLHPIACGGRCGATEPTLGKLFQVSFCGFTRGVGATTSHEAAWHGPTTPMMTIRQNLLNHVMLFYFGETLAKDM